MSQKYIPITELPQLIPTMLRGGNEGVSELLEGGVSWDIELPDYINSERIELNVARMRALHRLGAFSASCILGYYGKTTREEPVVSGYSSNGTAFASNRSTIDKAERQSSRVVFNNGAIIARAPQFIQKEYGEANIVHCLNMAEISRKVQDERPTKATRDKIWAAQLSSALGQSYRSAAREHLIGRDSVGSKVGDALYMGATVFNLALLPEGDNFQHIMTGSLVGIGMLSVGLSSYIVNGRGIDYMKERRWSLNFSGTSQPDRYLGVAALSAMPNLLRVKKDDS